MAVDCPGYPLFRDGHNFIFLHEFSSSPVGVLLAIALAYLVLSPEVKEISWTLVSIVIFLLGVIIVITAIQQRRTFLRD